MRAITLYKGSAVRANQIGEHKTTLPQIFIAIRNGAKAALTPASTSNLDAAANVSVENKQRVRKNAVKTRRYFLETNITTNKPIN